MAQILRIDVQAIDNGYLLSGLKREGYREAETGQTYYATLADVEGSLADMLDRASQLELPTNDDDGGPF